MKCRITEGTLEHLDDIALIFDQYRVFYNAASDISSCKQFLQERFSQKDSKIFIAVSDTANILGFTQLYPTFSSVSMKRVWILNDLFVRAEVRKSGIGKSLIEHAIAFAKKDGAVRLSLSTAQDNPAQFLYEAIGFKQSGFKFYNYSL
ncbi:Ribosomal protein S18 acetylase RimI [Arachidicoccus rhizosphaerae]|jgi:ribosomal protein S18 acetylase RimI-like enzyme|uniref:Ribosomal protein S18 acetylase RimI n=1 Tax=Arachidicoccus rhizosphaerae TaxID=551991 RepID=A0A1H4A6A3_9BACT|nr:GNAT family N-acetyltransferase [Arachidicoccus rhizosphaerae]SEA31436.1 Ribosomal protein S18 acetylase RimI [Arachidicoccus rhizosphaerae]